MSPLKTFLALLLLGLVTSLSLPAKGPQLYTCGMHPWIIQDHPGNCPICGMKLEPVRKQSSGATASTAGRPRTSAFGGVERRAYVETRRL